MSKPFNPLDDMDAWSKNFEKHYLKNLEAGMIPSKMWRTDENGKEIEPEVYRARALK